MRAQPAPLEAALEAAAPEAAARAWTGGPRRRRGVAQTTSRDVPFWESLASRFELNGSLLLPSSASGLLGRAVDSVFPVPSDTSALASSQGPVRPLETFVRRDHYRTPWESSGEPVLQASSVPSGLLSGHELVVLHPTSVELQPVELAASGRTGVASITAGVAKSGGGSREDFQSFPDRHSLEEYLAERLVGGQTVTVCVVAGIAKIALKNSMSKKVLDKEVLFQSYGHISALILGYQVEFTVHLDNSGRPVFSDTLPANVTAAREFPVKVYKILQQVIELGPLVREGRVSEWQVVGADIVTREELRKKWFSGPRSVPLCHNGHKFLLLTFADIAWFKSRHCALCGELTQHAVETCRQRCEFVALCHSCELISRKKLLLDLLPDSHAEHSNHTDHADHTQAADGRGPLPELPTPSGGPGLQSSSAPQSPAPQSPAAAAAGAGDWREAAIFETSAARTIALEVELELQDSSRAGVPGPEYRFDPVRFEQDLKREICAVLAAPEHQVLVVNPVIDLQRVSLAFISGEGRSGFGRGEGGQGGEGGSGRGGGPGVFPGPPPGRLFVKLQNFLQKFPVSREFPLLGRAVRVSVESAVVAETAETASVAELLLGGSRPIETKTRFGDCPLGCGERIEDVSFARHVEKFCGRRLVACPLSCGAQLHAEEAERHVQGFCGERRVACGACGENLKHKFMEMHGSENCEFRFLHCGCGERMRFNQLGLHKSGSCRMRVVACSWCAREMHAFEIVQHKNEDCTEKLNFEQKLLDAVWTRELGKVRTLAADGVSVRGERSKLALHAAAAIDELAILDNLIDCGASVQAVDPKSGQTPLHVAVSKGHSRIAHRLLTSGSVNLLAKDNSGRTAFAVAVFADRLDMVKLLLKYGADASELAGFSDLILNDWIKDQLVLEFDALRAKNAN